MFKKISRQVFYLGLISLFTDMASEMLYPVTPIFLSSVLGTSMVMIGVIEGAAEVTAGLLKGYFGLLSDKMGKRSVFVSLGYAISALSKPLPGLFPNFFVVMSSRVSDRIGKGIRTSPRDALLASYSNNNTGAVFGFHRGMDTIGAVTGPLLALLLLSLLNNDFRLVFIAAFVPSLAAVIVTLFIKDKAITPKTGSALFSLTFWKESPKDYKILVILTTIFSLANSSDVFLILRSQNISKSTTIAILVYVFYNLVYALSSYPAGMISDKMGKKKIFIAGLLIFSLVYLGFGISNNSVVLWLLFAFYGLYAAATEGILKAWISDMIPDKDRGSAIGILTMFMSFGIMGGSVIAGILWDNYGPSVPFLLSSAVSFLIALLLFILIKDENLKKVLPNI